MSFVGLKIRLLTLYRNRIFEKKNCIVKPTESKKIEFSRSPRETFTDFFYGLACIDSWFPCSLPERWYQYILIWEQNVDNPVSRSNYCVGGGGGSVSLPNGVHLVFFTQSYATVPLKSGQNMCEIIQGDTISCETGNRIGNGKRTDNDTIERGRWHRIIYRYGIRSTLTNISAAASPSSAIVDDEKLKTAFFN